MFGIKRSRNVAPAPVDATVIGQRHGWPGRPLLNADGSLTVDERYWDGPGSIVTDDTVLSLPAAWRCLNIIANGIGILDLYATDSRDEQHARIEPSPEVLADPWPMVSPMNWKVQVINSMVLRGDCYVVQSDPDPSTGYPRQLPVIHPDHVQVESVSGIPLYWIDGRGPYGPLDILHFRGMMMPGELTGVGVVEAHRRGLGYAMDLDAYGSNTFSQGAVPPMILHVNRPELSREQAEDIQERWMRAHGFGQRTPAVLPNSITTETVAFSPQDAEYLSSRVQSATEVCWIFGIDPRVLALNAGQGSLTYANLEMAQAELARDSFLPWTTRIEQMMSRVLPRHIDAKFSFAAMMRPTMLDRYKAYDIGLSAGFLTVDEVRRREDLPPIAFAEGQPKHESGVRPLRTVSVPTPSRAEEEAL